MNITFVSPTLIKARFKFRNTHFTISTFPASEDKASQNYTLAKIVDCNLKYLNLSRPSLTK